MGVSVITAYAIATRDDLVLTHGGPAENGKYVGWITLGEESRYRPLLNTEAIYDTPQDADAAMRELAADIRASVARETGGKHPLDHVFDEVT